MGMDFERVISEVAGFLESARRMTTEEYLRFLQSFPAGEPDRNRGGFPGDELEL